MFEDHDDEENPLERPDRMIRYSMTIDFQEPHIQHGEALETLDDVIQELAARLQDLVMLDEEMQQLMNTHDIRLIFALST